MRLVLAFFDNHNTFRFFVCVFRHELEDPFCSSEKAANSFGGIFVGQEVQDIKEQLNLM